MATEMISLKLDGIFLKEIDSLVKDAGYQNRTEFIRNTLREKIEDIKLKQAMIELASFKGKSAKKTTDEDIARIRDVISKKFR